MRLILLWALMAAAPGYVQSFAGQRWDGSKAVVDSYVLQMPTREPHAGEYLVCGPVKPIAGTSISKCFWWNAIELESPIVKALVVSEQNKEAR